jgi:hypothetical protein
LVRHFTLQHGLASLVHLNIFRLEAEILLLPRHWKKQRQLTKRTKKKDQGNNTGEPSYLLRPRHSWSGYSLASHRGGSGSRPGLASGICGGQSGAWAGFLRILRFPLPIFIPPTSPSSQSPGTGTIGQSMAAVPRGHPIWTPPPT